MTRARLWTGVNEEISDEIVKRKPDTKTRDLLKLWIKSVYYL